MALLRQNQLGMQFPTFQNGTTRQWLYKNGARMLPRYISMVIIYLLHGNLETLITKPTLITTLRRTVRFVDHFSTQQLWEALFHHAMR